MPRLPTAEDFGGPAAPRPSRQITEHRPAVLDTGTAFLSDFGTMVEQETQRVEGLAVEDALNKLRERRVDLTMGQDRGFQHVRGGSVIERPVLKEFPEAFGREVEQLSSGLTSRRARQAFQQRASGEATGFRTDLLRHVAAQTDTFQTEVFGATVKVESGYAAAMYGDAVAVGEALQRVETAAADEAVRLGVTDSKWRQFFTQKTSGEVISAAVRGALAGDDSETALAILEQYKDKLSEAQHRSLDSAVNSATSWDRGQRLAEEAFSMQQAGKSATQIEKFMIDSTRGSKDTYANAQTVLRQLHGARKEQQGEAADAAQSAINKGVPWQKVRGQYLDSMDPATVAAFDVRAEVLARGSKVESNFGLYFELSQRIARGATDVNLPEYVGQLSNVELNKLDTQLRSAQTPKGAEGLRTLDQQLTVAEMRMSRTETEAMTIRGKGLFRDWVITEIDMEMARNGGRELSYQERQAIIRRGTFVAEESGWFSREVRGYHYPPVPPGDRQLILQAFEANKMPVPSEAEIQDAYNKIKETVPSEAESQDAYNKIKETVPPGDRQLILQSFEANKRPVPSEAEIQDAYNKIKETQ